MTRNTLEIFPDRQSSCEIYLNKTVGTRGLKNNQGAKREKERQSLDSITHYCERGLDVCSAP